MLEDCVHIDSPEKKNDYSKSFYWMITNPQIKCWIQLCILKKKGWMLYCWICNILSKMPIIYHLDYMQPTWFNCHGRKRTRKIKMYTTWVFHEFIIRPILMFLLVLFAIDYSIVTYPIIRGNVALENEIKSC